MAKDPLQLPDKARYIGSLPKDDQICDFYEVVVDGNIQYVYIATGPEENPE
ncbi:MAG: hypothetical protein QM451_00960 [Bacillota bacterium]|jgi:hypothetical protein|nr:hypothetical protein [Bacillota bacterium]HHT91056.1 hypothetical protein [Bacillota bacterium]